MAPFIAQKCEGWLAESITVHEMTWTAYTMTRSYSGCSYL